MKYLSTIPSFPLLARELTEQAARPRTYVLRVVYACAFFGLAVSMFSTSLVTQGDPAHVLGQGRQMFAKLVMIQFFGIYLFLPAMTSGVITYEKERNCLGLLFLTRLGPWTIVLEKLFSRLIPMFTFLLLAMPLMAFTYMLGGVSLPEFWGSLCLLSTTCWEIGAIAVLCSAFFRTMPAAFVASYALSGMLLICCSPATVFFQVGQSGLGLLSLLFAISAANLFIGGCCLFAAKSALVERAFVQPHNLLLSVFRVLDDFYTSLNSVTGGVVLFNESTSLPKDHAIAWRETSKQSMGTVRYLFRILVALEVPLIFILMAVASAEIDRRWSGSDVRVTASLVCLLWIIAIPLLSIKATSLIAGERTHETLEVLLTIPQTGREIILEKFHGVWRLLGVLAIPFLTVFVFEVWWESSVWTAVNFRPLEYLCFSVVSLAIFFPLIAWIGLWIGLQTKTQMRAILYSLGLMFGWVFLPLFPAFSWLSYLSPAYIVVQNEFGYLASSVPPTRDAPLQLRLMIFLCLTYALLLWQVRRLCLTRADRYLGRCEPNPYEPEELSVETVPGRPAEATGQM